jgi:CBS domain-containing protein
MKCRDVMQPYEYHCGAKDTALHCAQLMRDHHLRIVPVTDEQGRVLGVITDRDLVVRLVANERTPHTKLRALISAGPLVACSPEDDLQIAVDHMFQAQVPRALVVDELERCVGVIGISDIARARGCPDQVFRLLYAMDSRPNLHPIAAAVATSPAP